MSVDNSELMAFQRKLEALRDSMPQVMEQLVVGEGVYAVKQARSICKEDGIVNNGTYRMNFHAGNRAMIDPGGAEYDGSPVLKSGTSYKIDVYNNLDYAKHLEYGFRSHFVPGYWEGHSYVYQPGFPGGMYVGPYNGFVRGHFTLMRAIRRTKQTQDARLQRKADKIIREGLR
ncbi:hypothetical protein KL86CLO1_10501 [uncultured Eubacteriales bacterium]|uniref:HK97 gp10 family phage protein n=1 Tax=uncultured Eubacteriales bacterium TaxID=172733 RepID=A0A212J4F6_9FIRM|nr:hypothetical protein KL86CLO1_10501 [uncultured Eubacteriales bacterium]